MSYKNANFFRSVNPRRVVWEMNQTEKIAAEAIIKDLGLEIFHVKVNSRTAYPEGSVVIVTLSWREGVTPRAFTPPEGEAAAQIVRRFFSTAHTVKTQEERPGLSSPVKVSYTSFSN